MKKSMMKIEQESPAIIAPPRPLHNGSDREIGTSPTIVVRDPKKIGSSLAAAPSAIASRVSSPDFLFKFILSTRTIPCVTTIPKRESVPIRAGNDNGVPVSAKIAKTPDTAIGIVNIIRRACLYELNWITIVPKIRIADIIMA